MDPESFRKVERALKDHLKENADGHGYIKFKSDCTICGQMKKRKPGLSRFASEHDVMLFVSGKNSSNGRMLFEYCRSLNARTHWISEKEEVEKQWFDDCESIGISGATSTSRAQLECIMEEVKKLINS
jgi:4-hydroxy-3-methylbut-2-enyl diphosphate reductase